MFSDEYLLTKITIAECGEPLIKVRTALPSVLIKINDRIPIKRKELFVRKSLIPLLEKAQTFLPSGYSFILNDGYRPLRVQRMFFARHLKRIKKKHPSWDKRLIRKEASLFVGDPETFTPHNSGGAIDITLSYRGKELDMGGFHLYVEKTVKAVHLKRRKILADALRKAGFINYPLEWWHWSYGDRYWAAATGRKSTIYSDIDRKR